MQKSKEEVANIVSYAKMAENVSGSINRVCLIKAPLIDYHRMSTLLKDYLKNSKTEKIKKINLISSDKGPGLEAIRT